jgi:hypothetical protein
MARIEGQIQALEGLDDDRARQTARTLVQAVLEFHRIGLARVLDLIQQAGAAGQGMRETLAGDALVSSLLTLHGLHPLDLGTRLKRVLVQLQPLLAVQGSTAKIGSADGGTVRIILAGPSASSAPAVRAVKQALEAAILEAAPDVVRVEFIEPEPVSPRVSLPVVRRA